MIRRIAFLVLVLVTFLVLLWYFRASGAGRLG
jgi:hypothetical protein